MLNINCPSRPVTKNILGDKKNIPYKNNAMWCRVLYSVYFWQRWRLSFFWFTQSRTRSFSLFPLVTPFAAPVRSVTCHQQFKAGVDESSSSSRSSSIIGTSWDRVCLQVSVRYVLPVAMICAIILCHGTKCLVEVISQGCWGDFFYTSPLSKSRTANWLQNWWLITIQSRVSCCHCTLWGRGEENSKSVLWLMHTLQEC